MLFSELIRYGFDVYGTVRGSLQAHHSYHQRIFEHVDVLNISSLTHVMDALSPDVIVNAVGLIRHLPEGREPLPCITINAAFPHLLWKECTTRGIRCIHYSTDCVFDGKAGRPYTEQDRPTASDVYGLTKFLGEIAGPLALTIRTSIIGPELRGGHSLLEWFLAQQGSVRGYTGAIYAGLPTSEHARILATHILPRNDVQGLYQVAASPISKYDLLRLLAHAYEKHTDIIPDDNVQENKSLSSEAFRQVTGYEAPPWPEMIAAMREAHMRMAVSRA